MFAAAIELTSWSANWVNDCREALRPPEPGERKPVSVLLKLLNSMRAQMREHMDEDAFTAFINGEDATVTGKHDSEEEALLCKEKTEEAEDDGDEQTNLLLRTALAGTSVFEATYALLVTRTNREAREALKNREMKAEERTEEVREEGRECGEKDEEDINKKIAEEVQEKEKALWQMIKEDGLTDATAADSTPPVATEGTGLVMVCTHTPCPFHAQNETGES